MYDPFIEKVSSALREYEMLRGVRCVIVALSGGADSMSLLKALHYLSSELDITVCAAHLNHNLRGDESRRDETFVREQCEKLGVRLYVKSIDISSIAQRDKLGLEECGRRERYSFFTELRGEIQNSVTATAHTASDNAETVLLNITRGCGLDGLCGIPPVRQGIIRPLIKCTREDVEMYCSRVNIPFVTDSTNLCDDYSRNIIRLNVLPQLKRINPNAENAVNRLSDSAHGDLSILKSLAQRERDKCRKDEGLDIDKLGECSRALLPHIIKAELESRFALIPEKRHIDLIIDIIQNGHGAVEVKKNIIVKSRNGVLMFCDISKKDDKNIEKFADMVFSAPMSFVYNEKKYSITLRITANHEDNNKINKKLLIDRLSCGIISCDTIIRTRRSGDVFSPLGRGCTKTVKKLFSEMKLSAADRETRLLIANGSEVLWIEGIGVSEKAAASAEDDTFYEVNSGG